MTKAKPDSVGAMKALERNVKNVVRKIVTDKSDRITCRKRKRRISTTNSTQTIYAIVNRRRYRTDDAKTHKLPEFLLPVRVLFPCLFNDFVYPSSHNTSSTL